MRFGKFINEGTRGTTLSEDEAFDLLTTKCKKALSLHESRGMVMYRGMPYQRSPYLYYTPKDFVRTSANTKNYYTLIIDNDPAWKGYPKRSQSLICTTENTTARGYGKIYMIFPFDGAKIGKIDSPDFWEAFNATDTGRLDDWVIDLEDIIKAAGITGFNDSSYPNIVKKFKEFDKVIKNGTVDWRIIQSASDYDWIDDYDGDLLNLCRRIFNPKANNIMLFKAGDARLGYDDVECWTDSPCVAIAYEPYPTSFFKKLRL